MRPRISEKSPGAIRGYRDLAVWQLAMDLVVAAYSLARKLPAIEKYELSSQIRRSSVSVPANIAEGYGRRHLGEYLHHLYIASGLLKELETELLIGERLGYFDAITVKEALDLSDRVGRMLTRLTRRLKESTRK